MVEERVKADNLTRDLHDARKTSRFYSSRQTGHSLLICRFQAPSSSGGLQARVEAIGRRVQGALGRAQRSTQHDEHFISRDGPTKRLFVGCERPSCCTEGATGSSGRAEGEQEAQQQAQSESSDRSGWIVADKTVFLDGLYGMDCEQEVKYVYTRKRTYPSCACMFRSYQVHRLSHAKGARVRMVSTHDERLADLGSPR